MPLLMLTFSAFFAVFCVVTASTTVYMIKHVLQKKMNKQPKKHESQSKVYKGKCENCAKFAKLKTGEPSPQGRKNTVKTLEEELEEIDFQLSRSINLEDCLKKLEYLNSKYPNETRILWMIGKAHQKTVYVTQDSSVRKYHIDKGISACQASLDKNFNQSEAHKWMSVLIGLKGETQTNKEKIESGKLFKKHLDAALDLEPDDPMLQHLAGRFCYEISSLNWVEQKLANSAFPEPLNCSYDKALEQFLQCEQLYKHGFKENRLFIAKCYIAKKNYSEAVKWLRKAQVTHDYFSTNKIDEEINILLQQYYGYR